jgi:hypothetical protein
VVLAERWNGTAWAIQPTPHPRGAKASALYGVSCTSASACTATGFYYTSTGTAMPLAERWDGMAWAIQRTPSPATFDYNYLTAVSCTSAAACTASGYYLASTGQVTLAERWNGTAWAIQPTPNPRSAKDSVLYGVSCTSAAGCTASGSYYTSGGAQLTLAERWNGTAWAIQPTPSPRGVSASYLAGVSCTSASACTAVGYYTTYYILTNVTLAER